MLVVIVPVILQVICLRENAFIQHYTKSPDRQQYIISRRLSLAVCMVPRVTRRTAREN